MRVTAPAEGGRAYRALFVAVFSALLGLGIVIPLLPRYAETLGATGLEIGAIFSGFSVSRALLMPVFGRLSDRRAGSGSSSSASPSTPSSRSRTSPPTR